MNVCSKQKEFIFVSGATYYLENVVHKCVIIMMLVIQEKLKIRHE